MALINWITLFEKGRRHGADGSLLALGEAGMGGFRTVWKDKVHVPCGEKGGREGLE